MKRTTILLSFLTLFGVFEGKAQAGFEPHYNVNFYNQKDYWSDYYDSVYQANVALGDSTNGPGFNHFNRWVSFWEKFMPESGDFNDALTVYNALWQQKQMDHFTKMAASGTGATQITPQNWEEIGPMNQSDVLQKNGIWQNPHLNNNGSIKFNGHVAKIDRLFLHPTNSSIVFACAGGLDNGGGGLFKSIDGGNNWFIVGTDQIPIPDVYSFAIKPAGVDPMPSTEIMFIGLSTGAVYRSLNGGETWFEAGYNGTQPYPYVTSGGSNPGLSLPYSMDFMNFSHDKFDKNYKMNMVPDASVSNNYSRLVVARYNGLYYSDNYFDPISADISNYQLNNAIQWKKFDIDPIINSIPGFTPTPYQRDYCATDFEYFEKNGIQYYVAHIALREVNDTDQNNVITNIRQYILISDNQGATWSFLGGGITGTNTGQNVGIDHTFRSHNIEALSTDPTFVYIASVPAIDPTAAYLLYKYDLDNDTWQDLSELSGFGNNGMPTQADGFAINPSDEEEWWFYTNSIRRNIGGTLQVDYSEGHDFHADCRDILVLNNGTILMGHDGGVSQSTDGGVHFDITSEGLGAAQTDYVALGQKAPYYVTSGVWHAGLKVLNPETGKWHYKATGDGSKGYSLFLNNEVFATTSQNANTTIYSGYDNLSLLGSGRFGFAGSENVYGRAYITKSVTVSSNPTVKNDRLFYTNTDFVGIEFAVPGQESYFPVNSAYLYTIPNEPDKLVVAVSDPATDDRKLVFLDGMSSSTPNPVILNEVNLNLVFDPSGNSTCDIIDVVFDTRRNGDYWLVLKGGGSTVPGVVPRRIVHFDNSQGNFEDITHVTDDNINGSTGSTFPYFISIQSLAQDRQTGRLYIGTSYGVYYLDEDAQIWRKYSANLPSFGVDMDIVHCEREIYASTSFRGIWKANLAESENDETLQWKIEQSQIWSERMNLFCTLVIEPGAVLTVADELVVYGDQKIIVKPGGKLIVDGGTITSECGDYWKGIEVMGDYTQPQNPQLQGHLITKNGAKIEYAKEAIATWELGNYATTGGIVHCTNTEFVNNRTSAYFYPYQDINGNGVETLNTSFFTNCEFLWDDNYIDQHPMIGVILNNVNGVRIIGSDFIDSRTSLVGGDSRPTGIFSLDAGYKVIARNTTLGTLPTHEVFDSSGGYDVNNFKNLEYGIYSLGANSARTITADHCRFENVMYGINLSAVDNAVLTRNLVEYTYSHPIDIGICLGITLSECTGYTIQGNTFNNSDENAFVNGILAFDTGSEDNEVRLNYFNDQFLANYARGNNSNTDAFTTGSPQLLKGLTWLCNEGVDNKHDLLNYAEIGIDGEGVKLWQGNGGTGGTNPVSAGNKFTDISYSSLNAHILHTDDDQLLYYTYNNDPQQIPDPAFLNGDIQVNLQSNPNECLSIFQDIIVEESRMLSSSSESELSTEITQLETSIETKTSELAIKRAHGDRQALHQLVSNLTPANSASVRATLLDESPFLSQSLLEELGEKTPGSFSHEWYTEVIEANIEVIRSTSFWSYLQTKEDPIPTDLLEQLEAQRGAFTERGSLEMDVNRLSAERHRKANLLLVNEFSDSSMIDWDAVESSLILRNNTVYRAEASDLFLGRGQTAECLALLDSIDLNLADYTLDYERTEMQDFSAFKRYVLSITDSTGVVEDLDSTSIQQLSYMADNFTGRGAIQARNLLCFHAGLCEEREVLLPHSGMQIIQSENSSTETGGLSAVETQLKVIPNPNKGEFVLEVPKECSISELSIVDIQGKEVPFENLEQIENRNRILILNKETGILFLKAQCNDGSVYSTRIVVNK